MPCSGGTTFPAGCTSATGFSTTTGLPCSTGTTLPAGCTSTAGYSPTTGVSCATGAVVGATGQGSATLDYEPIPAAGVSIYTGASKTAGVTFKVRATGSAMTVSSLALDVNDRIWLEASNAYLMQGSTVLATVPLSASTVTEVTAGSLWRVMFSGFSVVAPAGVDTDLTVAFDRPTVTQNNNTVTIQTSTYIRATDGTGFTTNVSPTTTRTMSFSAAAASAGTLTTSLSATSPLAQSVSGLSTTASVLTPVKLMDFDLKGKNSAITVTTLYGTATASTGTIANEVASFELRDGSTVLSSVTGGATATFSSLNVQVPKDGTKTLSVWAQMNPIGTPGAGYTSSGAGITFTVVPLAHSLAYDANFNTVTDTTASVAGNTQYMFQYAPSITMGTTAATTTTNGASIAADFTLPFTVTAPSGQAIYVNKTVSATEGDANVVVEKTVTGNGGTVASSMVASSTSGTDATSYYIVPAGQSRTFTVYSHVPVGGSAGYTGTKLYKVYWDTDGDTAAAPVAQTWGLQNFNTASVYVTAS
ncbi:MAG: hypothetical protein PHT16_00115 [Candidatus Pacebacteria bacterium]|nr:hypothetical protein [Candidatus Paceibacterota bacterium]